jgi:pimeloyl-ACP methyl ester carboxylesterase
MQPRVLLVASWLTLSGCLNLDFFVFRARAAKPDEDVFTSSSVPERLRTFYDDIPSSDGVKVTMSITRHDGAPGDEGDPARNRIGIFYCHGQSSWIGTTHPRADALWRLGYTVAVVDARGYGKTPGSPTEVTVAQDVDAARAFFERELGGADKVGLYGRSLGTALCLTSAANRNPRALALESSIGALQSFVNDSLQIEAPSEWFFDSVMDNDANIQRYAGALLVMHGTADDFVQPKYGRRVFDLSDGHASPREFWSVEGANHDNVPCSDLSPKLDGNGCEGSFSPEYLSRVTTLFDGALRRP